MLGWGFEAPTDIVVDGADLWVASWFANSLTEVSASSGHLVRQLSGARYRLDTPYGMALDGELSASTGALVRMIRAPGYDISGPKYKFDFPDAMVVDGTDLFVGNARGNSVTEVDPSTSSLVKVFAAPK